MEDGMTHKPVSPLHYEPADSSDQIKVRADNVNVYYSQIHALHDISMQIADRSVTAFIGPSGCGKSTFLRCINRMNDTIEDAKVSGSIRIDDEEINSQDIDPVVLRARVGMVFQKPNPFPKSIYDNIAYGPRIHGLVETREETDAIVEESLKRAGLWDEVSDGRTLFCPGPDCNGTH